MSSKPAASKLTLTPRQPADREPPRPVVMVRSVSPRLPAPLTSIVGRDGEVAAIRINLVDDGVRWLTLTGPGGVGKTRLALRIAEEVAAAFADGVVFVPLAPIIDPELVLPAIVRELGLRQTATQSVAELLSSHLRRRRLLLILDNVEQVAGAAPQVAALLGVCPRLSVLATSRTRLRVSGERRFPVSPLALPASREVEESRNREADTEAASQEIERSPAVQLFVERAQAVEPHFVLDAANAPTVAAVCRRLDGLPLAIELAAVQMRFLSAAELLARLEPALPLLAGGPTDAPDRLRTMRNAIAWSYNLLAPAEQTLLRRLSVFVGGCGLAAAEAVAAGDRHCSPAPRTTRRRVAPPAEMPSFLETLAALVDASLVQRHDAAGETPPSGRGVLGGESRLTLLQTIREFAWEHLETSGELAAVATRHADWCIRLAESVRQSGALSRREGLARLEIEHPNLRAALRWLLAQGQAPEALHLAGELAEFWMRHGHLAEGKAWLEAALAADNGAPTAARAKALVGLSMLLWWRDGFAPSQELLREAEAVARAAGDAGAMAYTRLHQGYVAIFRGDLELAEARAIEGLTTAAAIPQAFSLHGAFCLLAEVALARGDDARAREHFTHLLELARAGGDEISLANALAGLATLAERRGEFGAALNSFADALVVCQGFGDHGMAGFRLEQAAATTAAAGRDGAAVRLFAAANVLHPLIEEESGRLSAGIPYRHEPVLRTARTALGEEAFAALWAAGGTLSLDAAVAEVRVLAAALGDAAAEPATGDPGAGDARAPLSRREQEVLQLMAEGLADKAIAGALGISRRTASKHVAAVRAKLGAASRTAAVAHALRQGVLDGGPPPLAPTSRVRPA